MNSQATMQQILKISSWKRKFQNINVQLIQGSIDYIKVNIFCGPKSIIKGTLKNKKNPQMRDNYGRTHYI